ncbi:MAG: AAA family ATPase [Gammaproteobacteria bacterium]
MSTQASSAAEICAALQRLDGLLARAVALAQSADGAATDPYRGLHLRPEEVARLLSQPPGQPLLLFAAQDPRLSSVGAEGSRLAALATAFDLDPFDLDVLVIALAPEFDLRYERLYAFLQDDVTRRRPSVDLVLNLLCETVEARLVRRARFAADAPLCRSGLLHLVPDPQNAQPPLLAHFLKLDDPIASWLLGQEGADPLLAPFCRCIEARLSLDRIRMGENRKRGLSALVRQADTGGEPLKLYFHGPAGTGKRSTAEALAQACASRLLCTDIRSVLRGGEGFEPFCRRLRREAWLQQALLLIEGVDALAADGHEDQTRLLCELVVGSTGPLILTGSDPDWAVRSGLPGVIELSFGMPDFADRRALWQTHLGPAAASLPSADLDTIAQRFRLTPGQIADACDVARSRARWHAVTNGEAQTPEGIEPTLDHLMHAARAESGHALARVARKLAPKYRWADLILPDDQRAQLQEICLQYTYRTTVYGDWGFDRKLSLGKGLNVLFSGPPGTGKTMAAEVIANALGLDLYKIDLSQVVSKYIGDTEKNLDRIFAAAEDANAILFFDEADALFGKRSEVKDAHDRYANIEVGYLLQKMEEYQGIAILATNLRGHLDEAFVRRMQAIVELPFPDEVYRHRIWKGVFPREAPIGEDVDLDLLAREVRLAGGNIKNIGLASAFYAASDGGVIHMPHLLRAVYREHQKLGRTWNGGNGALS